MWKVGHSKNIFFRYKKDILFNTTPFFNANYQVQLFKLFVSGCSTFATNKSLGCKSVQTIHNVPDAIAPQQNECMNRFILLLFNFFLDQEYFNIAVNY